MKVIILLMGLLILSGHVSAQAQTVNGNTITAASCNTTDVQNAINAAVEGDTVLIPAGTCTWTSGVTISGKGITVTGAGSGRIIAYDNGIEVLTIGTGAQTISIAGYSPGFSASSITVGETLLVFENNARTNWMQGTVASISGTTLVMNITITGGSGSTHRWLIATLPTTVLNNNSATTMFTVTEDTSLHTNLSGFQIAEGTGPGDGVDFNSGGTNGQAILLHDCWIQQPIGGSGNQGNSVWTGVSRGVVWNCSFDSTPFSRAPLAFHLQPFDLTAWTTPSFMGMNDTNGQHNFYVEDCDFHAYLNATDNDEGARSVFRYNLFDNAGFGTHGVDTGIIGQRYFEYYDNTGVYNGYSDGTTFPMNWWFFVRGGTYVIFDNTLPLINSQDYPNKPDVDMTEMSLQRDAGPVACWGASTSAGKDYYAPRQVGMGYVTGTGIDGLGQSTYSGAVYGYSSTLYVGDPEPAYIWGNSRQPLTNVETTDYGFTQSDSCPTGSGQSYDTSTSYIISGRDYFNGSTPKPGYTPYTYPHPLRSLASAITYGDLNGAANGTVTIYDAELVAQYVVGLTTLTPTQLQEAEVSSSTETTPTIYDAFLIAEYAVGLITQFPVQ